MISNIKIEIKKECIVIDQEIINCEIIGIEEVPSNFCGNKFIGCSFTGVFYGINFSNSEFYNDCDFSGISSLEICNFTDIKMPDKMKQELIEKFPNNNWENTDGTFQFY